MPKELAPSVLSQEVLRSHASIDGLKRAFASGALTLAPEASFRLGELRHMDDAAVVLADSPNHGLVRVCLPDGGV